PPNGLASVTVTTTESPRLSHRNGTSPSVKGPPWSRSNRPRPFVWTVRGVKVPWASARAVSVPATGGGGLPGGQAGRWGGAPPGHLGRAGEGPRRLEVRGALGGGGAVVQGGGQRGAVPPPLPQVERDVDGVEGCILVADLPAPSLDRDGPGGRVSR